MQTYDDLVELARQCAKQAHFTRNREVAREFWRMAIEYQQRAAKFDSGKAPDIGPPPTGWKTSCGGQHQ
jgi:hypothetical protein